MVEYLICEIIFYRNSVFLIVSLKILDCRLHKYVKLLRKYVKLLGISRLKVLLNNIYLDIDLKLEVYRIHILSIVRVISRVKNRNEP